MNSIDPASASLALKARILAAAAAAPSPTRRQAKHVTRWVVAAGIAAGIAFVELAGGIAHPGDRPLLLTLRLGDGWALACAALTWLTARLGTPHVRTPEILRAACIAAPAALILWGSRFHGAYTDTPAASLWACIATSLACALVPLIGFLWTRRGSEPRHAATMGAAIGTASGAWAGLLSLLRCPETAPLHLLVAHAMPLVLTTIVGALAGARFLGIRGYRFGGRRRPRICEPSSAPMTASTPMGRM